MDSPPEIHPHHHHKPLRHWMDMLVSGLAIVLSVVSLYVALQDGNAMKQLVQANSWPYVVPEFSNLNPDTTPHFRLMLVNKGVGPAKIETLEVFYNGKPTTGPRDLVTAMIGPEGQNHAHLLGTSDIVGSVLSARESVDFLDVRAETFTAEQNQAMRDGSSKIDMRLCYCSVFDECWIRGGPGMSSKPRPVKHCVRPKVNYDDGPLDLADPN